MRKNLRFLPDKVNLLFMKFKFLLRHVPLLTARTFMWTYTGMSVHVHLECPLCGKLFGAFGTLIDALVDVQFPNMIFKLAYSSVLAVTFLAFVGQRTFFFLRKQRWRFLATLHRNLHWLIADFVFWRIN